MKKWRLVELVNGLLGVGKDKSADEFVRSKETIDAAEALIDQLHQLIAEIDDFLAQPVDIRPIPERRD